MKLKELEIKINLIFFFQRTFQKLRKRAETGVSFGEIRGKFGQSLSENLLNNSKNIRAK
jgi:hypothetical protein